MENKKSLLKRFWDFHDWEPEYISPIIFGIPGGLASYFALRRKKPLLAKKCLMLSIVFLWGIGGPVAYFAFKKDNPVLAKKYLTLGFLITSIYILIPVSFLLIMSSSDDFDFLPSQIEIKTFRDSTCNTSPNSFSYVSSNSDVSTKKWDSFTTYNQFNYLQDIAIDSQSNVYIADVGTFHAIYGIQKFSPDGKFITKWRSIENSTIGGIKFATKIAIDRDDNVYVTESENFLIQKFTSDGQFVTEWKTIKGFGIDGLAIDSNNSVYGLETSDNSADAVRKWTSDGEKISIWYVSNYDEVSINKPTDIAIDIFDRVYLLEGNEVHQLDCKGNYQNTVNLSVPSSYELPQNLYVDSSGFIYTISVDEERQILKFTPDGQFISLLDSSISEKNKWFRIADNITIDSTGKIFAIDTEHGIVQKLT